MEIINDSHLIHKVRISFLPTPIEKLENLSDKLKVNLYLKRDDLTGLAMGGNKSRKLDFLIKDALTQKAEVIITMGAVQSNHCRQTAAACKKFNLECILILEGKEDLKYSGNLLLDKLLGAKMYIVNSTEEALKLYQALLKEIKKKIYFIPAGGSNPVGSLGYINAYKEILEDEKRLNLKFDYIFFATSSLGTQTGLVLRKSIYGGTAKIIGINIVKNFFDLSQKNETERIIDIIKEFNKRFQTNLIVNNNDINIDDRFCSGYGILMKDEIDCIKLFSESESILLDPVYTARAANGMIYNIKNKEIKEGSNVLFIHTGGHPTIFTEKLTSKF